MTSPLQAVPRRVRTGGFTLVELLTVIAIIVVLAAILLPLIGRIRQSARTSTDTGSMRSLGHAMLLYASENKGIINCWYANSEATGSGSDNTFWGRAWPYLNQSRLKSSREVAEAYISREIQSSRPDLVANNEGVDYTIAINNNLTLGSQTDDAGKKTYTFQRLQNVPQPAKAPYIAVGKWGFGDLVPADLPATQPSQGVYFPYSNRQTILVTLDGSTKLWGGSDSINSTQLRNFSR